MGSDEDTQKDVLSNLDAAVADFKDSYNSQAEELAAKDKQIAEAEKLMEDYEGVLDEAKREKEELEKKVVALQAQVDEHVPVEEDPKYVDVCEQNALLQQQTAELLGTRSSLEQKLEETNARLAEVESQLPEEGSYVLTPEERQEFIDTCEKYEALQTEADGLRKRFDEQAIELGNAQKNIDAEKEKSRGLGEKVTQSEAQVAQLNAELQERQNQYETLASQLEAKEKEISRLVEKNEALGQRKTGTNLKDRMQMNTILGLVEKMYNSLGLKYEGEETGVQLTVKQLKEIEEKGNLIYTLFEDACRGSGLLVPTDGEKHDRLGSMIAQIIEAAKMTRDYTARMAVIRNLASGYHAHLGTGFVTGDNPDEKAVKELEDVLRVVERYSTEIKAMIEQEEGKSRKSTPTGLENQKLARMTGVENYVQITDRFLLRKMEAYLCKIVTIADGKVKFSEDYSLVHLENELASGSDKSMEDECGKKTALYEDRITILVGYLNEIFKRVYETNSEATPDAVFAIAASYQTAMITGKLNERTAVTWGYDKNFKGERKLMKKNSETVKGHAANLKSKLEISYVECLKEAVRIIYQNAYDHRRPDPTDTKVEGESTLDREMEKFFKQKWMFSFSDNPSETAEEFFNAHYQKMTGNNTEVQLEAQGMSRLEKSMWATLAVAAAAGIAYLIEPETTTRYFSHAMAYVQNLKHMVGL